MLKSYFLLNSLFVYTALTMRNYYETKWNETKTNDPQQEVAINIWSFIFEESYSTIP